MDLPEVSVPEPAQLFLDANTQKDIDAIQAKLIETEPRFEKNSEFKAIAYRGHSVSEVQQAYIAVAQRYSAADHIIMAYALRDKEDNKIKNGFCDDREYGAGARIRKKIFELKSRNTVVFVLRKYGGVHLGFGRFAIIEQMATDAINLLNSF